MAFSEGSQLLDLFENDLRAIWDILLSLTLNAVILLKIFKNTFISVFQCSIIERNLKWDAVPKFVP